MTRFMLDKKQLIISAFENLDVNLLDVLLDDDKTFSNVSKKTFVAVYARFVRFIKRIPEFDTTYKSYKAFCDLEDERREGIAFVNNDVICYIKLIFTYHEDEITGIRQCKSLETSEIEISKTMIGISFYKDEEKCFKADKDFYEISTTCQDAVNILQNHIEEEGALSMSSIRSWFLAHEDFYIDKVLPCGYSYSECAEFINYFTLFRKYKTSDEVEELSKKFCHEFYSFPIVHKRNISDWLERVNNEIVRAQKGFWLECDFRKGFFLESHVKVFLPDFYYTQNLGIIMNKYREWIPASSSCEIRMK